MYSHPEDIDIELIIHSLERFFSVVDRIFRVNVIGGEPFLYPHMDQVIEFLNSRNESDICLLLSGACLKIIPTICTPHSAVYFARIQLS